MKKQSAPDQKRDRYILVQWPESQLLMDHEWFDAECYLANNERTIKEIGSSAYFVPERRMIELESELHRIEFDLNDAQAKKLEKWKKKQLKKDPSMPAAGERWTFMFTPTGIGTVVKVKDECTGEVLDLTDWENW